MPTYAAPQLGHAFRRRARRIPKGGVGRARATLLLIAVLVGWVRPAQGAFQKLGPFSYFHSTNAEAGGEGSAVVILVPPSSEARSGEIWPGIFIAASNKRLPIQEFTSLDKLQSEGETQFESLFLYFDHQSRAFTKVYLSRETAISELPQNLVLDLGPARVAKSTVADGGTYVSISAFDSVISFLDFQAVANVDRSVELFEAYRPPAGIVPYTVHTRGLFLEGRPVTRMTFPDSYLEQNRCLLQDVKLVWDGDAPGVNGPKTERPGDLVFLKVEQESALALTLNGTPVVIKEDFRQSYGGDVICSLSTIKPF